MPHLVDVRDVSTDDVRIELELKAGADDNLVMAYLFKNTSLQTTFAVNMTCLVPTENAEVGRPERLDLKQMLWYFLHFRLEVVTSRLEHELEQLKKRIHILEGFEKVFDALDEIIKIIRKSDGKADSAEKIMKRFSLDAEQTDAILELKLYRLARLEILVIQQELAEKRKRARQISTLLKDEEGRWKLVREELEEIQNKYGNAKLDPRRSRIEEAEEVEYTAESFIVEEDNVVIVSRDGWVKRQKEVKDLSTTRLREGDSVLAAVAGSTRATMVFFSNFGVAYTSRIVDVPASTGYGDPVQKLFKLKDGEKIVAAFSLDPRVAKKIEAKKEGDAPPVHADRGHERRLRDALLAAVVRRSEHAIGPPLRAHRGQAPKWSASASPPARRPSSPPPRTRARCCRKADEVNFLSGPGRGVILIKIDFPDDKVIGAIVSSGDRDLLTVETTRGSEQTISTTKYRVTGRGGKGKELMQRGGFTRVVPNEVPAPVIEGASS